MRILSAYLISMFLMLSFTGHLSAQQSQVTPVAGGNVIQFTRSDADRYVLYASKNADISNAVAIEHIKLENEGWERDKSLTEPTEQ